MGKSKRQVSQGRAISQRGRPSCSSTRGRQSSQSQPPVAVAGSNTPVSASSVILPVTTSTLSQSSSALSSLPHVSMDQLLAIIRLEINDRSLNDHVATGPPASSSTPTSLPAPIPTSTPHGELQMHLFACRHTVPYYSPPCLYFVMVTIIPDLNSHCLVQSHLSHAVYHCIS